MWNGGFAVMQRYMGSGLMILWFVIALVYLFFKEEKKMNRVLFIYVPALTLLLFFNPLFTKIYFRAVGGNIYFRICWILPVTVVIAYAVLVIYQAIQEKKRKPFLAIVFCLIGVSGTLVYSNPLYSVAENAYHVPQAVVDICEAIELPGREVMAVFPREHLLYVRQYTSGVCMPYGRDYLDGAINDLAIVMDRDEIDVAKMSEMAKEVGCHYVVFSEEKLLLGDINEYDYELFDTIDGYVILKDTTMNYDLY